jgi:plastocyanin
MAAMNRIVRLLLVGSALLLAGALAACGGDSKGESAAAPPAAAQAAATQTATPAATDWPDGGQPKKSKQADTAAATPKAAAPKAASSAPETVQIKGFAFGPKDVTVKVGQKITWTNQDSAAHTATAQAGESFDSGTLAQGASFSFTPTKAGTIAYICAIHPNMTATITVQ